MFNRIKVPQYCPHCHAPVNTVFADDAFDVPYNERPLGIGPFDPGLFGDKFCSRCGESLFAKCAACDGAGYLLKEQAALFCTNCGHRIRAAGQVKIVCRMCSGKGGSWMSAFAHQCAKDKK